MSDPISRFIMSKVNSLVARGVAKYLEGKGTWQLCLLSGETLSGIEHPQEFGLASKSPNGGDVVSVSVGGQRENTVAVTISNDIGRPTITQGQTALHDARGTYLILDNAGTVHIYAQHGLVVHGDVSDLQGTAQTMEAMRILFNAHIHTDTTAAGVTGGPTTTM